MSLETDVEVLKEKINMQVLFTKYVHYRFTRNGVVHSVNDI